MANKTKLIEKQFISYYELYSSDIYRFCMSRLNCNTQLSEDCMQEAFLILFKNMRNGVEITNPRAFLYKTAYNFTMQKNDKINTEAKRVIPFDIKDIEISDESHSDINEKINFEEFKKRLDKLLNKDEKALYQLRFIDDMKIKDISQKLDITPANCAMRISRLRQKIINNLIEFNI